MPLKILETVEFKVFCAVRVSVCMLVLSFYATGYPNPLNWRE